LHCRPNRFVSASALSKKPLLSWPYNSTLVRRSSMQALGITYIALGILIIVLHVPHYFQLIGPNPFWGVRIAKAFESKENWCRTNRYWAKHARVWGGFIVLLGLCCFLPLADDRWVYVALLLPLIAAIPPLIMIWRYIRSDEKILRYKELWQRFCFAGSLAGNSHRASSDWRIAAASEVRPYIVVSLSECHNSFRRFDRVII
jgi:hypothetical protein